MVLTKEEKFNLMIALMEDMRGDWSCNNELRPNKIKELAIELNYPKTIKLVDEYFENMLEYGDNDGRHFRCSWKEYGGYENAPVIETKMYSKEYIDEIKTYCNHPHLRL